MAIGSDPEIGTEFTRWGLMSEASREAWFKFIREEWGADLCGRYAKLIYRNTTGDNDAEHTI
jgi:hypothetical protein